MKNVTVHEDYYALVTKVVRSEIEDEKQKRSNAN
mgnify:FL=1